MIADISTSSNSGCLLFNSDKKCVYGDILNIDVDMDMDMDMYGDKDKDIDVYKNVDFCSRKIL
jgi:hypothetical protein